MKQHATFFCLFVLVTFGYLFGQAPLVLAQPTFSEEVFDYHLLSEDDMNLGLAAKGNTGSFTYTYDIKVPPGQAGLQPDLRLDYVSGGENGPLGVGWTLNTPYIQCRVQDGGLKFRDECFDYVEGSSRRELIKLEVAPNEEFGVPLIEYRFKNENESTLRFFSDHTDLEMGRVWLMLSKDHVWTKYGPTDTERLYGVPEGSQRRIYRWYISKQYIEGPSGDPINKIEYFYTSIRSETDEPPYLHYLYYGNSGCRIFFDYAASRPDTVVDNRAAFPIKTTKLLRSIRSESDFGIVDFHTAYHYRFSYGVSGATDRSLLTEIEQLSASTAPANSNIVGGEFDKEASPGLPSTVFVYEGMDDDLPLENYDVVPLQGSFDGVVDYDPFAPAGNPEYHKQYYQADYNGDGCTDVLHITTGNRISVWLGRADGTFDVQAPLTVSESLQGVFDHVKYKYQFRTGDFNGDGMQDVLHIKGKNSATIWFAQKDEAGNFNYFNIRSFLCEAPYCDLESDITMPFMLPNESGDRAFPAGSVPTRYKYHIADFNGDGMDDYMTYYDQTGISCNAQEGEGRIGRYLIYYSEGTGSFVKQEMSDHIGYDFSLPAREWGTYPECPPEAGGSMGRQYGIIVADVNRDGLPDLVHPRCASNGDNGDNGVLTTFINWGPSADNDFDIHFLPLPTQMSVSRAFGVANGGNPIRFQMGDYNGDGVTDMLNYYESPHVIFDLMYGTNNWRGGGVDHFINTGDPFTLDRPEIAEYVITADLDGDRKSDFVMIDATSTMDDDDDDGKHVFLYRSLGDGNFGRPDSEDTGIGNSNLLELSNIYSDLYIDLDFFLVGDFTGNGKTDFLNLYKNDLAKTVLITSSSGIPDVMVEVEQKMSDTSSVTVAEVSYAPASSFADASLPIAQPVVSSIKVYDGVTKKSGDPTSFAATLVRNFEYGAGVYDRAERKFLGFGTVTETQTDNIGNIVYGSKVSEFYTDPVIAGERTIDLAGRPKAIRKYSIYGNLLTEDQYTWLVSEGPEYPKFPYLYTKASKIHGADPLESLKTFTYDPVHHGVTEIIEVVDDAETVTTSIGYLDVFGSDPGKSWLWRKNSEMKTGSTNGILRQDYWTYHPNGDQNYHLEGGGLRWSATTWTQYGNPHIVTRSDQPSLEYQYDLSGMFPILIRTTDNQGTTWDETCAYDSRFGYKWNSQDHNGNVTHIHCDGFGRQYKNELHDKDGVLVSYEEIEFDDFSVPTKTKTRKRITEGEFVDTSDYHDLLGRLVQRTVRGERINGVSQYASTLHRYGVNYTDLYGPVSSDEDFFVDALDPLFPDLRTRHDFYDYLGRLKQRATFSSSGMNRLDYTYDGDEITETEFGNIDRWKKYRLDGRGNLHEVAEMSEVGTEIVTSYEADGVGQIRRIVDSENNEYLRGYDFLGRQTTENHPDSGNKIFSWTGGDALAFEIDAENYATVNYRDSMGRLDYKNYQRNGSYGYFEYADDVATNSVGRMTAHRNLESRLGVRDFDSRGLVLADSVTIGSSPPCVQEYEYDEAGRLKTLTYTDGYQATYQYYFGSSWLKQVTAGTGGEELKIALGQYAPQGIPTSIEYYWGGSLIPVVSVTKTVDKRTGQLLSIRAFNQQSTGDPADDILNEVYSYTPSGDLDELDDLKKGAEIGQVGNHYISQYSYDNLHRLTKVIENGFIKKAAKEMVYDDLGRIKENWTDYNKVEMVYGGIRPHAPESIKYGKNSVPYPVTYDGRGNMITSPAGSGFANGVPVSRTMAYNAINRVESVEVDIPMMGVFQEDFFYDAQQRRVRKERADGSAVLYFTNNYEVDSGEAMKYVTLGSQRLATVTVDGVKIQVKDRMGSVRAVCDETGAVTYTSSYDVWGVPENETGDADGLKDRFSGAEYDKNSYFYNLQAREYDPVFGLFGAADDMNPNVSDPQMLNRYAYVRNSPTRFVDPSGHGPEVIVAPAVALAYIEGTIMIGVALYLANPPNDGVSWEGAWEVAEIGAEKAVSDIAGVWNWGRNLFKGDDADDERVGESNIMLQGEGGVIYVIPGAGTRSGLDYIGRSKDLQKRSREKKSKYGRDYKKAKVIRKYGPKDDPRAIEQQEMNKRGGKSKLDNKRDEITKKKWKEKGVK